MEYRAWHMVLMGLYFRQDSPQMKLYSLGLGAYWELGAPTHAKLAGDPPVSHHVPSLLPNSDGHCQKVACVEHV